MKSLKPSHREKKRYLLIRGKNANKEDIEKAILDFIGILGYAKAGINFVNMNNIPKEKIILAVNRKSVEEIRTSFLMNEKEIIIESVSGVLNKFEQ
jgi:RNase P/RNase MRP subunit POP5